MLKINHFIEYFGDAAACPLYVSMLYLLQGGRSTESTDLPATEMKSVYRAVRTGPLNKVACTLSLKG